MDKLIITVAVDSSLSFPQNHYMPRLHDIDAVAAQYVSAVNAGASLCHLHGVYAARPDGVDFDIESWGRLTELVRTETGDPLTQYGIASGKLVDKRALMEFRPDMMSTIFAPYDARFHYDPASSPRDVYDSYTREELVELIGAMERHGIAAEAECFHTGAYWTIEYLRSQGLLSGRCWATLFFGWKGAVWSPQTIDALTYMVRNLPPDVHWNASFKGNDSAWTLIPTVIALGGHVRVGWEDNPYLPSGELARSNAELVEVVVGLAAAMGREVATVAEAREMTGLQRFSPSRAGVATEAG